jgi:hypothetical protein
MEKYSSSIFPNVSEYEPANAEIKQLAEKYGGENFNSPP